jgi:NitT/TauT family transport system ATP-binding protein
VSETTEKPPIIELQNASKWFPDPRNGERLVAVHDISLTVPDEEEGEFVALLGPSCCGKSTILNLVAGLVAPDAGAVRVFGKPVTGPNPLSVTVPQAYTCFPWLRVLGNVEFGLGILGKPKAEQRQIATDYLEKVGLGDRLSAYPRELSGGMQQRVAIARTLALKPPIVLMDEPFGALDAQTRAEMQQMLLRLWTEEQNTILFITHDITEALLLADRVIVLSPRPAKVVHDLRVPFPRPREASIVREETFINLSGALIELLKRTPTEGQVTVTV